MKVREIQDSAFTEQQSVKYYFSKKAPSCNSALQQLLEHLQWLLQSHIKIKLVFLSPHILTNSKINVRSRMQMKCKRKIHFQSVSSSSGLHAINNACVAFFFHNFSIFFVSTGCQYVQNLHWMEHMIFNHTNSALTISTVLVSQKS